MFLPCLEIYPLCPTLWASATNYYLTRAFKISKYFLHWPGRLVMLGCSAVGIEPQKKPSRLTSRKRERSLEPVGVIHSIVPMQMSRHIGVRWSSTERFRTTTVYSFGRRLRPYNVAYLCAMTKTRGLKSDTSGTSVFPAVVMDLITPGRIHGLLSCGNGDESNSPSHWFHLATLKLCFK